MKAFDTSVNRFFHLIPNKYDERRQFGQGVICPIASSMAINEYITQ